MSLIAVYSVALLCIQTLRTMEQNKVLGQFSVAWHTCIAAAREYDGPLTYPETRILQRRIREGNRNGK